jgi:hypothetical protein
MAGREDWPGDSDDDDMSTLASFHMPAHAEVLVVTHLLELPRDLALPQMIS